MIVDDLLSIAITGSMVGNLRTQTGPEKNVVAPFPRVDSASHVGAHRHRSNL
jgi:hypothetical protein